MHLHRIFAELYVPELTISSVDVGRAALNAAITSQLNNTEATASLMPHCLLSSGLQSSPKLHYVLP